jgi:hypothetical protein
MAKKNNDKNNNKKKDKKTDKSKKDETNKDESKKDDSNKDDPKKDENDENDKPKIKSFIFLFDINENNNNFIDNLDDTQQNNTEDDLQDDAQDDPRGDAHSDPQGDAHSDPQDDPQDDIFDDYYNDPYYDDDYNNRKRKQDFFDYEPQNNLGSVFKKIIDDIKEKNKKKQKIELKDDFKDYFKESDKLLTINKEIKTLKDLIELGESYDPNDKNRYVINLRALNKCVNHLKELDSMIGMKNIKEMIVDLIFFRLQNLEDTKDELWHLVIQGTPGSGKTEVAKIIGKLYYSLGIVKKDKFTLVKRSDLIGKYLGHTAKMTQEVFNNGKGGVIFIDEAYSLGNPEQRDSFSKECIDTINQNLTENRDTVVFIAGYKEQLDESFFSYNPGLNRRFKMRMNVDKYNASDLREIFIKKINENKWNIYEDNGEREIPLSFFEKNIGLFKYNGGDMENLWHLTKIVHARRIFGKSYDIAKKITCKDLENALKLYSENDEVKNRNESISKYVMDTMYC